MKEDESYKKFLVSARFVAVVWFFSTPIIIVSYFESKVISLSILAFAVIISLIFLLVILANGKENLSKNIDILLGNEEEKNASSQEAKNPSNEQVVNMINIPEDYIPEPKPRQTVGGFNFGGNDMGNEIGCSVVFLFLFFPLYLNFDLRFFLYDTFKVLFICSLLYSLLAFWRLRKAYFRKGWVKVFARPNNIVVYSSETEGGVNSGLITEGWTFTFDEQQYNIRQRSRNHYVIEQEIYWNPKTNKLIINHNGYKVLFFLYSLVAYFFFFLGLLFSNQLALHPEIVFPLNILLFAPVLPTGLIIFCEMYFNQVTLPTVIEKLGIAALILGAFVLLVLALVLWNWFFSDSNCSYWMYMASGC
tara:strand:- start:306 stop:1388 length:1083 start_codon:yes stop_codon:yes gene_type:complete